MKREVEMLDYEPLDVPDWVSQHPDNPFLHGPYAPVAREIEVDRLETIEGTVPRDLNGVYLRNGPNPRFDKGGVHHWFDGDGMTHALVLRNGVASYRNRWSHTRHFQMESDAGQVLWPGYAERPNPYSPPGAGSAFFLKDSANTDVKWYNGAAVATFYQCGIPFRIDPVTGAGLGEERFHGALPRQVSAHQKVDDSTGEMMFFDYSVKEPFLTYGVGSASGELVNHVEIPLPGARLPHDMAITRNYSILHDLPLYWDETLSQRGIHKLRFHRDRPARFGVIPRHGGIDALRWFEAAPCYIYHVVNAFEEGDEVVMDACRMRNPYPERKPGEDAIDRMCAVATWRDVVLWRWRFNLKTGHTREEQLDDLNTEFPMANFDRYHGQPYRYCYNSIIPTDRILCFTGLVKYDLQTGRRQIHEYEPGVIGSETPFAPRDGSREEDDGYLVTFVTDSRSGQSEARIFDAQQLERGPVCRLRIPQRIPAGFHACWINADKAFN